MDTVLGLTIFWRLVLAHLLTDFTLQSNRLAAWKRASWWGHVVHAGIFMICGMALCGPYIGMRWPVAGLTISLPGWLAIALLTVLHVLEDRWRAVSIMNNSRSDSLGFFLLDQLIHLACIFLLVPLTSGGRPEAWVFLAILFVLTTHFSTIVIYYLEKDIQGRAAIMAREKYWLIGERLGIAVAVILPGWWAVSSVAAWCLRPLIAGLRRRGSIASARTIIGNSLAVVLGIIARFFVY